VNAISKQVAADRSLMYKKILLITIIMVAFLLAGCQNQERESGIFMEMVIFLSGSCYRSRTLYFVVKNDGTLIGYDGISHNRCHLSRGYFSRRNLLISIQERGEIRLSEQDFQDISDLVNKLVESYDGNDSLVITHMHFTLLYEGILYGNSTMFVTELMHLFNKIIELIPLTIRGG